MRSSVLGYAPHRAVHSVHDGYARQGEEKASVVDHDLKRVQKHRSTWLNNKQTYGKIRGVGLTKMLFALIFFLAALKKKLKHACFGGGTDSRLPTN